ncbi:hypothetical protein MHT86_06225 [Corynebacterium mastitidis]|uniref:hypothetical protein n=1 Tax=Corynebacterium mastitidis TaxID=161890 RepID=UPI0012FF4C0C|nr:hypothetical protein [Corynebacterium mastitidis]MCH6197091.1 hypothetical protein [Corynebacterium mastitidis]
MKKLSAGFTAGLCALAMGVAPAHASATVYMEEQSYSYAARYIMMVPTEIIVSVADVFDDGSAEAEAPVEAEPPAEDAETQAGELSVDDLHEGDTFSSQMVQLVGKTIDSATSSKSRGGSIHAVTTYEDGTVLNFAKEMGESEYKLMSIEKA